MDQHITNNDGFFPINGVLAYYIEATQSPYKSIFSLEPFLEGLEESIQLSSTSTRGTMANFFSDLADKIEVDASQISDLQGNQDVQAFIQMMMPSIRLSRELKFITPPFRMNIVAQTKALEEIIAEEGRFDLNIGGSGSEDSMEVENAIMRHRLILKKLYQIDFDDHDPRVIVLRDNQTGLLKYYHLQFNSDFIDIIFDGEKPILSDQEVHQLYKEIDNVQIWEQYFPPSLISFKGFSIGTWVDVTDIEALSEIRNIIYTYDFEGHFDRIRDEIAKYVQAYIGSSEVYLGTVNMKENFQDVYPNMNLTDHSEKEIASGAIAKAERVGAYAELSPENRHVFKDLTRGNLSEIEQHLKDKGFKNLFLYAVVSRGEWTSIIEIASKDDLILTRSSHVRVLKIASILEEISGQMLLKLDSKVTDIIQDKFTPVHSAIEWKFREVANQYLMTRHNPNAKIEPIIFRNLLPLYGQADIVGSSTLRVEAIRTDLLKNLQLVQGLIKNFQAKVALHVLDKYQKLVSELIKKVSTQYHSKDENEVVNLLTKDIHPYLASIQERHQIDAKMYQAYIEQLDDRLGIIYEQRKRYEEAVTMLNDEIGTWIEAEDDRMQKVLPHYFEMYSTDGVEYNIYLGQSLLEQKDFVSFDIEEFRIWQLKKMVGIIRLVDDLQTALPMPMKTAQLIFAYNHSLGIRFRMDEKRFDVDGAYNARYEIIKKRIDKATILGTKDRLTVKDKIAIVYVNDKDKDEYLDYIQYLIDADYLLDEVEDLDLNPMQGVDGLKALRVTAKKLAKGMSWKHHSNFKTTLVGNIDH